MTDDTQYVHQLEHALVTLRVMYDNVELRRIVDGALAGRYSLAWFAGFQDTYNRTQMPSEGMSE